MVRILVADEHEMVRLGLRDLLTAQPGWCVVGEAGTGPEAVALAEWLRPDVVVLEPALPGIDGLAATRRIREALPATEVLILAARLAERELREALLAGARGYLLKSDPAEQLVAAVAAVAGHRSYFTTEIPAELLGADGRDTAAPGERRDGEMLTPREREVVRLLAAGRGHKKVADALGISAKTVETHRAAVVRKLGLGSLADLVRYAARNQLIVP